MRGVPSGARKEVRGRSGGMKIQLGFDQVFLGFEAVRLWRKCGFSCSIEMLFSCPRLG
jgi:hypothetical protein